MDTDDQVVIICSKSSIVPATFGAAMNRYCRSS